MDAFVVKNKRFNQLFANTHVVLFIPGGMNPFICDEVARIQHWIQQEGGTTSTTASANDDMSTFVLVKAKKNEINSIDVTVLRAFRAQISPHAIVVAWDWILECMEQHALVAYEQHQWVDNTSDQLLGEPNLDEPAPKRQHFGEGKVAPEIKESAVHPPFLRAWKTDSNGSLHYLDARPNAQTTAPLIPMKIAAFDLDGTLIVTKSGKRFPENERDWKLFHSNVKEKLQKYAHEGFLLVIISNQHGIAKGKTTALQVRSKIEAVVTKLNVPMLALFATHDDLMRKPRYGAWEWLLRELHLKQAQVDSVSFYCGDAAGRPKIKGRNKDFAATDYKFALNIGVAFRTPEDFFLLSTYRIHTRSELWDIGFDPRELQRACSTLKSAITDVTHDTTEIVLFVGPPASGKSHFAAKHFGAYTIVNQDELVALSRCKSVCLDSLSRRRGVVIDGTNRDHRTRQEWTSLAKQQNVPIRCFYFEVDRELSMHLNTFRALTSSKKISPVAIYSYFKNAVKPEMNEGFSDIVKVSFQVDTSFLLAENQRLIVSFL